MQNCGDTKVAAAQRMMMTLASVRERKISQLEAYVVGCLREYVLFSNKFLHKRQYTQINYDQVTV